jgi:diguanylate cyclase (GGDEF)-like protein/PAS domain S-box-containing protein
MSLVSVLWVDGDAQQADMALRLVAVRYPDWYVVHSTTYDVTGAPQASQAWDAVVVCLDPAAQDVPAVVEVNAGKAVLMCMGAHQEAVAARAFRRGLGDYVLRHDDGVSHLGELLQRLEGLLSRRTHQAAHVGVMDARMSQRTLALLQEQRQALQATLGSMSQGILKVARDGRITVYNQRVLELLGLPEAVMTHRPTLDDLTLMQAGRGDFGEDYQLLEPEAKSYLEHGMQGTIPDVYLRSTRDGRTLEVRTTTLADGGLVRTFSDVSDYVRVENELRESEARFRSLNDLSSDWYWEHDVNGHFVQLAGDLSVNGISNAQVIGRTRWEIGALNMTTADWDVHRAQLQAQQPFRDLELQRERPDGSMHWITVSGVPVFDAQGHWRGYRGVGRDISESKQAALQIERLAFYDALTGLPNRRLLVDRLQRATVLAERTGAHGALLFIDLDNFKDLNDTLGHDTGDLLLIEVAQRLKSCVRGSDTVARFGGDEFVVLVEGLHDRTPQASGEAALVADQIAMSLGKPYVLGDASHHSTPSIGIALFGEQLCSVDELLKHADLAMYQAKAAGRNTQRFFDPDMQAAASARTALESDLRRGLKGDEMLLYYQPVVDSKGRLLGAEGLVRWNHPQRGLVMPLEFIPLAEQTGLILPLGQRVIEIACAQLVEWSRSALTRDFMLSVNVSVRQFRQPDFVEQVLGALRASGASPDRLKLELTESLLMTDVEDVIVRMDYLRSFGVSFSLDDFGTGYSSLSYLKRLPLDQLKIDRSFVRDLQTDPNDAAIVRTILALAHSLDLTVVAEGVETTGQLEFLKRYGCTHFQGYLFGRPMPADMLVRALRPAL